VRAIAIALLPATAVAQPQPSTATPPRLAFEVASVRPSGPDAKAHVELHGDRFVATAITVWDLIKLAYPIGDRVRSDGQLAAAAGWIRSARFDIQATGAPVVPGGGTTAGAIAPPEGAAIDDTRAMLRTLLADRFGLVVHRESRDLPAYALVVNQAGRLGPQLKTAAPCERGAPDASGTACGGFNLAGPGLAARSVTLPMFVSLLSNLPVVGRIVQDRTGLAGEFDLSLQYIRPSPAASATDVLGPSVFTALQEQLGLKLEPTTAPVEVVVIDRANPPAAD
jgi:uncharacterized protein (TIGR03435 family)